ncbi:MAG: EI24 domain-containing protein [Burkholderiaceae bacterium]|nr:EI24 domain-containing protein [Burkholderiaceae bacterium]
MKLLIDSFWRTAAYCLHPRVIALSLMPLLLMVAVALGLGYFLWDPALAWVRAVLASQVWLTSVLDWFDSLGIGGLQALLAPLLIVFAAMPLIVIVSLLVVAVMMTPSMLNLVAERRFQSLERRHGGSATAGAFASLGATLLALVALVLSIPLWFVPPLVLILPPLIWGWLTYKVMTYDVLAEHATKEERREIIKRHRNTLLGMGVMTGYLGAAPSLLWASGVLFLTLAPVLVPVAIWIYTLVFAFSALWFSHYALTALQLLRAERAATPVQAAPVGTSIPTDSAATVGLLPPPLI